MFFSRWLGLCAVIAVMMLPGLGTASAEVVPHDAVPAMAAQVRAEVSAGTLVRDHGVRPVCPRCDSEIVTTAAHSARPLTTSAPGGYGPADLAAAYDLPASSAGSGTIAIIQAGVDPNAESDLATYRSTYGLPACASPDGCLKLENYDGGPQPAPQSGGDGATAEEETGVQTSLDLDVASAACPGCHLLAISVPWQDGTTDNDTSITDVATAVSTAVASGANAISVSYGYTPTSSSVTGADLAAFDRPGIPITVASGEGGFYGGTHQSWPSDLPTVIAVGGTSLTDNNGTYTETAWNGSGSGCETDFPSANGQPAAVTADCAGARAASDVSAVADPGTGVAAYDTYAPSSGTAFGWVVLGGTSASAPFVGGLFLLAGNVSSVHGPNTLYAAPATDFNDITSGSNEEGVQCASFPSVNKALCNAGPGWDGPTGLGSPHGLGAF